MIRLYRTYEKDYTKGRLVAPFGNFFTIERPWLYNAVRLSCIPEGVYTVVKSTFRSGRNRGKRAFRVLDVPDRNGILIHVGNKVTDVVGCIAPGLSFSDSLEKTISSTLAFNQLWQKLPDKFSLFICEDSRNASELLYKEIEHLNINTAPPPLPFPKEKKKKKVPFFLLFFLFFVKLFSK